MSIRTLKDDTVIVFVDGSNLHTTPDVVQEAFAHDKVFGSPLPIVVTFDAEIETMLGAVGHYEMKDPNGFTEVKEALAACRGKAAPDTKVTEHAPESWKDARGRSMTASYVSSTESEVTFRLEDGRHSTMKLSLLSEDSQKRVAELAAE